MLLLALLMCSAHAYGQTCTPDAFYSLDSENYLGLVNPAVTQNNLASTVRNSDWAAAIVFSTGFPSND